MMPFDTPWWIIAIYLFALGSVVGSFLNVAVHRIPMHRSFLKQVQGLWSPPSRCPKCLTPIRTRDNIPMFGWLILRGRCRKCQMKISWRYPAVELFNGLMVVGLYFLHVPVERWSDIGDSLLATPFGPFTSDSILNDFWLVHARFIYHLILCELLLVASLIDFDLTIIPEILTDPWILVGLAGSALGGMWLWPIDFSLAATYGIVDPEALKNAVERTPELVFHPWTQEHPIWHGLAISASGACVGFGTVWAIRTVGTRIIGVEAVGAGDVWLMGLIGSFLGWQPAIIAMVLSLFFALGTVFVCLLRGRLGHMPYGPYLSLGALATVVGWPWIWPRTATIFELGPVFLAGLGLVMLAMLAIILGLLQVVKRLFGIDLYGVTELEWRAADQHLYQMGERPTLNVGQWKRPERWNGNLSGRGQYFEQQWRGR